MNSIVTLSISPTYNAANKCSTVDTSPPFLFFKVVHNIAEETLS